MAYRIVKKDKDHKRAIIEKNDSVVEFTIEDADKQQAEYEKMEKEWEAQIRLCEAFVKNVTEHHPDVAKMDGEKLVAAKMLLENRERIAQYKPKLKELKRVMKNYVEERKRIYEFFDWKDNG